MTQHDDLEQARKDAEDAWRVAAYLFAAFVGLAAVAVVLTYLPDLLG